MIGTFHNNIIGLLHLIKKKPISLAVNAYILYNFDQNHIEMKLNDCNKKNCNKVSNY